MRTIAILIVAAVIAGLIQLLCCRARHIAVKLIPVYLVVLGWLFCLYLYSTGNFNAELIAFVYATYNCFPAGGVLIAWIVYGGVYFAKKIIRNRNK